MAEFLTNPRRAPRALTRCHVRVQIPGAAWEADTEDIGPHGCQLVAPSALPRGLTVHLVVADKRVPEPLALAGKVAWTSPTPPWRVGVAYVAAARPAATRWFERLIQIDPTLGHYRRVPDRIALDALVYLGAPPKFLVDFTSEEVEVLRHIASGATVGELRDRLADRWAAAQHALFSLLTRGHVTTARGSAAHPESWKKILAQYEASFAADALPPPRRGTTPGMARPGGAEPATPSRAEAGSMRHSDVAAPDLTPAPGAPVQPPGEATAGSGWRGLARTRSHDAQQALELAREELAHGRASTAMALLRRAIQLAPGDPEIAAEMGRALRGGR